MEKTRYVWNQICVTGMLPSWRIFVSYLKTWLPVLVTSRAMSALNLRFSIFKMKILCWKLSQLLSTSRSQWSGVLSAWDTVTSPDHLAVSICHDYVQEISGQSSLEAASVKQWNDRSSLQKWVTADRLTTWCAVDKTLDRQREKPSFNTVLVLASWKLQSPWT